MKNFTSLIIVKKTITSKSKSVVKNINSIKVAEVNSVL